MRSRLRITLARLAITICLVAGLTSACASAHKRKARPGPVGGVPSHIETWAYDDGCVGGVGARAALVRSWVTFAESSCGPAARKARSDCHSRGRNYCAVMQYLDANWNYAEGIRIARPSTDNWFLHLPSPNEATRIYSSAGGGGYLVNQFNPAVRSFFRSYVLGHYNGDDGLFMDDQGPGLASVLYYSTCACSSTNEIGTDAALRAAHAQMSAALTHGNGAPFIQADNALAPNPYSPQGFDMLNHAAGVDGFVGEGVPENNGTLDPFYSTLLDQIAHFAHRPTGFVAPLSRAPAGASYQEQSRRVHEATMLLGYSPGHLVDWADLEHGSTNLAIWPEQAIYPTRPAQSMRAPRGPGCFAGTGRVCSRGGHNDVQVASGVYRREFGACYRRRVLFGACAAIVNTTAGPVTVRRRWLKRSFRHQITFNGGDVQSGGTLNLAGAPFTAGASTVAPKDAILLAP